MRHQQNGLDEKVGCENVSDQETMDNFDFCFLMFQRAGK